MPRQQCFIHVCAVKFCQLDIYILDSLISRGHKNLKLPISIKEQTLMDSEVSAMATFDFLAVDEDDENLRWVYYMLSGSVFRYLELS